MNRLDRALGILLHLRSRRSVSANDLARQFGVSPRTIYRDIESLAEIGVPVYAEMGRLGGFRLMEGYFLPPVMFSAGEAISILIGLTALRRFRARPFAAELETAEHKLLAALPDNLRDTLARAKQIIGFEGAPVDVFSLERAVAELGSTLPERPESQVLTVFLQAVLEQREVALHYRSPYSETASHSTLTPLGLLWDRDRWYLVGRKTGQSGEPRLWRADRVLNIRSQSTTVVAEADFDVNSLLGRKWLGRAMQQWRQESPVLIKLLPEQAERLKQDWYYGYARFETQSDGGVTMTYGEENRQFVFELLRWLGPGAELLEPQALRAAFKEDLLKMAALY